MDGDAPVSEMALPAVQSEIVQLEGMMGDRGSLYWKDETRQSRYRDLLDVREGRTVEEVEPGEDAFVSREMAPVGIKEFAAAGPGLDYSDYIRALQQVSDVVFQVPASERASLIASFNRLPDEVAGAISMELTNREGTGFDFCTDAEVRKFAGENGGRVVREWGGAAQRKMATVSARLNRCMDSMSPAAEDAFMDWHERLSDGQAAAVYRKLAS